MDNTDSSNAANVNAFTPLHGQDIATLAGGCFWGMEDLLRKLPGVIDTEVGYTGGVTPGSLRSRSSIPQKQPPAKVAISWP